jgi:hypothetical protein
LVMIMIVPTVLNCTAVRFCIHVPDSSCFMQANVYVCDFSRVFLSVRLVGKRVDHSPVVARSASSPSRPTIHLSTFPDLLGPEPFVRIWKSSRHNVLPHISEGCDGLSGSAKRGLIQARQPTCSEMSTDRVLLSVIGI